ncbi:MAG: VOC family protein [Thermoplasmata archaeon]|nr:VOC family protein [Thermoplasmata archaeon]
MAEAPQPGSIVHIELPVKDQERAKKFYGDLFGWKFQDVPEMNYTLFETANPPGGGMFVPQEGQFAPPGALNYILAEDLDAKSKEIEAAGGKILVPNSEVPGQGWFVVFQDSEGTVLALWKSAEQPQE